MLCFRRKRSSQLAFEAVALDPECGSAHACLGNSLFLEFFNTGQVNEDLLKQACSEYRLALQCGKEYRNADLHLNAGAAFRYEENYTEALTHLRQAVKYDPSDVIGSHGRLSSFTQFLTNVASGIQTAGNYLLYMVVILCTMTWKLHNSTVFKTNRQGSFLVGQNQGMINKDSDLSYPLHCC
ncbi:tetratricopeptide repeat protein [Teladorsagia circumcincta]|uniref:Tetratricopeptide repeat protein n=1 Tax=Teladorsagia circumcincta TaxID=45464 RepID=A0A2G9V2K5_TELCI|nr:tetratricopeptide repeat protein [Teladorsagia circumcincta]